MNEIESIFFIEVNSIFSHLDHHFISYMCSANWPELLLKRLHLLLSENKC